MYGAWNIFFIGHHPARPFLYNHPVIVYSKKCLFPPRRFGIEGAESGYMGGKKDDDICGIDCMTQVNNFFWELILFWVGCEEKASFGHMDHPQMHSTSA